MPDPIAIAACISAVVAVPALCVAVYHGAQLEKEKHEQRCTRRHPCKKGNHP